MKIRANYLPINTYTLSFRLDSATASQEHIRLFGGLLLNNLMIPKPSSLAMLLTGAVGIILWRRPGIPGA